MINSSYRRADYTPSLNTGPLKLVDPQTLASLAGIYIGYRSLHTHPYYQIDLELDNNPRCLSWMDFRSESRDALSTHSAADTSSDTDGDSEPLESRSMPSSRIRKWESYAEEVQTTNGRTAYMCLWTIKHGDRIFNCNYLAKKQLVKRHVETTHLKFKSGYKFLLIWLCTKNISGLSCATYVRKHSRR
jgi:hypothetical protein